MLYAVSERRSRTGIVLLSAEEILDELDETVQLSPEREKNWSIEFNPEATKEISSYSLTGSESAVRIANASTPQDPLQNQFNLVKKQ